jgi:hypothetical protein
MNINNTSIGLIRTWVPIAVGAVFGWFATKGLELDSETQAASVIAVTGFIQALYYGLARMLESRYPALGWLLGSAHTPNYNALEPEVVYVEVEVPAKKKAPVAKKKEAVKKATAKSSTAAKAWGALTAKKPAATTTKKASPKSK